jgi:hypothetical protein
MRVLDRPPSKLRLVEMRDKQPGRVEMGRVLSTAVMSLSLQIISE